MQSGRIHNMLIVDFKSLFVSAYNKYYKKLFSLRSSKYFLGGNNVLILPEPRTTSYGLESIKYDAAKQSNSLTDDIRGIISLNDFFKKVLKKY